MLWISSWMPQKGETLKATLTLKHWEKDLEIITHDMGLFYIDTSKSQNSSQYSKKEARNNNEID